MDDQSRQRMAQILAELAMDFQDQEDTESTLRSIVEGAAAVVPGTRWAGISLIEGREVLPRAPSDPLVARLDGLQSSTDEGPCLSALRDHRTVLIADMAAETRWPRFCSAAVELGVGSLLSFQLFVRRHNLGALNLYAGEPGVFDQDSIVIGELLAQHASVALIGASAVTQFRSAITSRDVIGQAKGLLMHRENIDSTQAFALMLKTSQNTNVKIVELAHWIVEQHNAERDRR